MKFAKVDAYCLRSDCGQYTIAKSYTGPKVTYTTFKGKESLGLRATAEEAKRLCEEDSE